MILLIDNYDSFSYNLYQLIGTLNPNIKVIRNDEYSVEDILLMNPEKIIISPGPGNPKDAGIIEELVTKVLDIPLLGVCLGHQAICEALGGDIIHAPKIMHGKKDTIYINNTVSLFKGLDTQIEAARYHSLIGTNLPDCLEVIGKDQFGYIMAVKHKTKKIYGLQFHPESIMTKDGVLILKNFLEE